VIAFTPKICAGPSSTAGELARNLTEGTNGRDHGLLARTNVNRARERVRDLTKVTKVFAYVLPGILD
jgi:hypothetical protein